jgi:hypothetical protein
MPAKWTTELVPGKTGRHLSRPFPNRAYHRFNNLTISRMIPTAINTFPPCSNHKLLDCDPANTHSSPTTVELRPIAAIDLRTNALLH